MLAPLGVVLLGFGVGWVRGLASADALLERMLAKIDGLCLERDRLKADQPGPTRGKVIGGRKW